MEVVHDPVSDENNGVEEGHGGLEIQDTHDLFQPRLSIALLEIPSDVRCAT